MLQSPEILSASIAGVVSVIICIITYISSVKKIKSQKVEIERQLERQFTIKLYELRLSEYPKAFEITELIQRRPKPDLIVDHGQIVKIKDGLQRWKTGLRSMIISNETLRRFYELRDTLSKNPEFNDQYSETQVDKIFKAKTNFRSAMRKDIGLLFEEEN